MVQPVTRQEHYHALRSNANPMEYCRNLFFDKTRSKVDMQIYEQKLMMWIRMQGLKRGNPRLSVIEGCSMIHKFFSEKFA